jgi:hypothetical protein
MQYKLPLTEEIIIIRKIDDSTLRDNKGIDNIYEIENKDYFFNDLTKKSSWNENIQRFFFTMNTIPISN